MEVSEKQRPLWNAIIIDILREFIKICKENNLVYYCCGGTAIGGDDAIGGMEIYQEISIIVRSFKSTNGGWL